MAGRVYSTNFIAEQGVTSSVSFFLDAGFRGVLREVSVYFNGVVIPGFEVLLIGDNGQTVVNFEFTPTSDRTLIYQGRYVFDTGFQLTTTHTVDVSASGYVLALP